MRSEYKIFYILFGSRSRALAVIDTTIDSIYNFKIARWFCVSERLYREYVSDVNMYSMNF